MTATELRDALATMLTNHLGEYDSDRGTTVPAIWVGEPPSDWRASGLEVVVNGVPNIRQTPAFVTGALGEEHEVRLVSHNAANADVRTAVRKILSRWPTAQARQVPANERLGILQQFVITIPA